MAPPKRMRRRSEQPTAGLEAAMDEERLLVLDILEGRERAARVEEARRRNATPPPTVRSMLHVNGPPPPRHGSIAGIGVGVTLPSNSRANAPQTSSTYRSLLDTDATLPPRKSTQGAVSTPTSPVESSLSKDKQPEDAQRRASDIVASDTSTPKTGLPQIKPKQTGDVVQNYQFDMTPSPSSHALPKRVSQGGKNLTPVNSNSSGPSSLKQSSMAAVMSGGDFGPLPSLTRGRDVGRHNPSAGHQRHSNSPSSRFSRSRSPNNSRLNTNSFNPLPDPGKYYTGSGKVINLGKAYKHMSTSALSNSAGTLGSLYQTNQDGMNTDASDPNVRVHEDVLSDEGDDVDEADDTSSEDDNSNTDSTRGRRRKKTDGSKESHRPRSLLSAAEEERSNVTYTVKSLLEVPDKRRTGVHPSTNFDDGDNTPMPSDDEMDHSDIRKAQDLPIYLSPVNQTIPNRGIMTVIRGDFPQMEKEADEGKRRLRKYLVATDLSDEAVYALEWTIGTILRDGDTLYTVYAMDENTGSGKGSELDVSSPNSISNGARAMQDASEVIVSQTELTAGNQASAFLPHKFTRPGDRRSGSQAKKVPIEAGTMSKGEAERELAIDRIKQTCIRLLRKTKLQVRIAIEAIHCKNPKHLILEAIDELEPTLVVLGSRGMNSLKGVLLGSFSNYLVTKSSVPVMVARKKLRKHHRLKTKIRLSNNLTTPGMKLQHAKIDELSQ